MSSANKVPNRITNPHLGQIYAGNKGVSPESLVKSVNDAFNSGHLTDVEADLAVNEIDSIMKARSVKYYKRTGTAGNYKYFYSKEEYDKAMNKNTDGGRVKGVVTEKSDDEVKMTKEDFVKEHKKLIAILESGTDEEQKKEAKEQLAELEAQQLEKAGRSAKDEKIAKVMGEFKGGKLKDSHGNIVTDRGQALAIAISEAK